MKRSNYQRGGSFSTNQPHGRLFHRVQLWHPAQRFDAAGKSPVIRSWKKDGVDARIEQFLSSNGPEKTLSDVDLAQKRLVHADFSMLHIHA